MSKKNRMTLDTQTPFGTHGAHRLKRLVWTICDAPVFSPRLRRKLRKAFARKLKGPFDLRFAGINWRLYPEENYCDRVIFARNKLPEQTEHEALADIIKPDMVFVDIGANVGSYSLYVAQKSANSAMIIALEPHPHTFQKLGYNLAANRIDNATTLQLASGPRREKMQLWSDGGSNIGHTSVLKQGTSNPKIFVEVNVVPLAEIIADTGIDHIDLLKIDIEGFEDQVLSPYFDCTGKDLWPKYVLIETAHRKLWKNDVVGRMKDEGYETVFQTDENVLLALIDVP